MLLEKTGRIKQSHDIVAMIKNRYKRYPIILPTFPTGNKGKRSLPLLFRTGNKGKRNLPLLYNTRSFLLHLFNTEHLYNIEKRRQMKSPIAFSIIEFFNQINTMSNPKHPHRVATDRQGVGEFPILFRRSRNPFVRRYRRSSATRPICRNVCRCCWHH